MAANVTGDAGSEDLLRAQFNALDTDGSGRSQPHRARPCVCCIILTIKIGLEYSLSHQEVKKALRNAKKFAGEAQLQQLFDACDKDGVSALH